MRKYIKMNTYKVHEIYNKYYDMKYLTDRIEFRYIYKYKHMSIQRNICTHMHKHMHTYTQTHTDMHTYITKLTKGSY